MELKWHISLEAQRPLRYIFNIDNVNGIASHVSMTFILEECRRGHMLIDCPEFLSGYD